MTSAELSRRERQILEAVIRTYVQTAEPAGSRVLARRFGLGVSPATIRNTMSDLEEKGFLFHPHTSAGRIPTDKAYRAFVDHMLDVPELSESEAERMAELLRGTGSTIEAVLRRAAQSLGVLTQELGIAMGPSLERAVLERLELVRVSAGRLLLVLSLGGGVVRTIFVEVRGEIADAALAELTAVLNERLAGLTLGQLRASLAERLRDVSAPGADDLLNIFVAEGDQLIEGALAPGQDGVVLGQASVLAEQPEFSAPDSMRRLLALTERPDRVAEAIRRRSTGPGISITIGNEHADPGLGQFTVVTAEYHLGTLSGVIGVIGPTRMPYDKVISLVSHTSRLLTVLLK
jgi:heat-inducible transcriptional repressor